MEDNIEYPINEEAYKDLLQTAGMSMDEAVKMRLQGHLPVIDICGHPFYVEVRLANLRPKNNFMSAGLDLNYGGFFDDETQIHSFLYHIPSMTEVNISPDVIELPKDTVLIRIPSRYVLDPISMARQRGDAPESYLKDYPMKMYSKAEVIALEKTPLVDLVKRNIRKMGKIKPKAKQRKKGI